MSKPTHAMTLDDETVAAYLRAHPDFFERMPGLISELSLPHDAGHAVSLVERQVSLLRERNIDMRKRLSTLVDTATDNDRLFEKTRALSLALVEALDLPAIDAVLATDLNDGFDADCTICYYHGPLELPSLAHLVAVTSIDAAPLVHLTQGTGLACGPLRADEFEAVFRTPADREGSAAMVRFGHGHATGLLAVGSRDASRFSPDMGALFVSYIGDLLARRLHTMATATADAI